MWLQTESDEAIMNVKSRCLVNKKVDKTTKTELLPQPDLMIP